jgi:hypothetical protein
MPDFGLKRENHDARLPGEFYPPMAAQQVNVQPRMIDANVEAAALFALNLAVLPPQIAGWLSERLGWGAKWWAQDKAGADLSPAPVLSRSLSS